MDVLDAAIPRGMGRGGLWAVTPDDQRGILAAGSRYAVERGRGEPRDLERARTDVVLVATPIDLRRVIKIDKRCVRVTYRLEELHVQTSLRSIVDPAIRAAKARRKGA
jgi:predicted GTPase